MTLRALLREAIKSVRRPKVYLPAKLMAEQKQEAWALVQADAVKQFKNRKSA